MATSKTTKTATRTSAKSTSTHSTAAKRTSASGKKTTSKSAPTPTKGRTVKVAPKAAPETAVADTSVSPETAAAPSAALRKRGLINAVAAQSGVKRRDAKAAIEAALKVMGEAIAEGRGVNLPGFGKLRVTRTKKHANAHVFVTKVRQPIAQDAPEPEGDPKDPLAEAAE